MLHRLNTDYLSMGSGDYLNKRH